MYDVPTTGGGNQGSEGKFLGLLGGKLNLYIDELAKLPPISYI